MSSGQFLGSEVREVITWTDRPKSGWGFNGIVKTGFPPAEDPPEGMDWNMWLGPMTKDVPFSKFLHPTTWRPWWEFGCGGLGDIGCHTIDTAYWALGLGAPEQVEVELAEPANPIHTPNGPVVSYHFPARNGKPPVTVRWHEGPNVPKMPEGMDWPLPKEGGFVMVGEKGGNRAEDAWRRPLSRHLPQAVLRQTQVGDHPCPRLARSIRRSGHPKSIWTTNASWFWNPPDRPEAQHVKKNAAKRNLGQAVRKATLTANEKGLPKSAMASRWPLFPRGFLHCSLLTRQSTLLPSPCNAHFPDLRSGPTAVSGASRQKQIPSR